MYKNILQKDNLKIPQQTICFDFLVLFVTWTVYEKTG